MCPLQIRFIKVGEETWDGLRRTKLFFPPLFSPSISPHLPLTTCEALFPETLLTLDFLMPGSSEHYGQAWAYVLFEQ